MRTINVLCGPEAESGLRGFADAMFSALSVSGYEERDSSNYSGGRYYSGKTTQLSIKISLTDDSDHEDRPYWIQFTGNEQAGQDLLTLVGNLVANIAPRTGYLFSRVDNFGKSTEHRIDYTIA